MRIVGLLVVCSSVMVGIGSDIGAIMNLPALIIVLLGTLGMLLFSRCQVATMFKAVFSNEATTAELQVGAKGLKMARIYILASGAIGLLIGTIIMLNNLSDPAAIGPAMAIIILSCLYGLFTAFGLCLPLQAGLEKRFQAPVDGTVLVSAVVSSLVMVLSVAIIFIVLLLSFSGLTVTP